MKKILAMLLVLVVLGGIFVPTVYALDGAPNMGDYEQDAEGFAQCYADYIEYYLFGISADVRDEIKVYVEEGYEAGEIGMMSLMPAFAALRTAGQVAEDDANKINGVQPTVDVIKKYYTLTDEQKSMFESKLVTAFGAIGLTVTIEDGNVVLKDGTEDFSTIKLTTEQPKSSTRMYLEAYLPGLTDEQMTEIETLVAEYAAEGGAPAGSGALWRCIREAGEFMGVEAERVVDMEAGTMSIVVTKEGEKIFANCSEEVQGNVAAKITEGMIAIGATATYTDGILTVSKSGEERLEIVIASEEEEETPTKSTTRLYLDAYIPGLSEDEKDIIEELVAEYTADGGSPAGSGTLWRCIREIGEFMGVEATSQIDMEAGTMSLVVTKEGETYLKDCSQEIQDKVIAKVAEGMAAIGATSEYADGVLKIVKDGEVRLTHRVLGVTDEDTGNDEKQEEDDKDNKGKEEEKLDKVPETGDVSSLTIVFAVISGAALTVLFVKKRKFAK